MNSEILEESYNKIAQWWTETQMKNPEYGMAHIRKAMGYARENSKFLVDHRNPCPWGKVKFKGFAV